MHKRARDENVRCTETLSSRNNCTANKCTETSHVQSSEVNYKHNENRCINSNHDNNKIQNCTVTTCSDGDNNANINNNNNSNSSSSSNSNSCNSSSSSQINPFTRQPYSAQYYELLEQRQHLPIYTEQARIVNAVQHNQVTLLVGETGSGKTTQVPHFLLEHAIKQNACNTSATKNDMKLIACTQPRRIAAISVASRVAEEMDVTLGETVGYRVRFQSKQSHQTQLLYLTDGMLLRDAFVDHDLNKYQVIVVDEAHERTVDTDVVLGLMKRLLRRRPEMRLVVMSATLDIHKIQSFFAHAPLIQVSGRMYPVEVYYMPTPVHDYVEAAIACILQVHKKEAYGDILCFLTSEYEIEKTVATISAQLKLLETNISDNTANNNNSSNIINNRNNSISKYNKLESTLLAPVRDMDYSDKRAGQAAEPCVSQITPTETSEEVIQALVLPLYGSLSLQDQQKVFAPTPVNTRKIVIATNIAETSVTIDGVVFVIDCGYQKQKLYHSEARVDYLLPALISKASAEQRKGRAGRTRPGKCYRLFTQREFSLFPAQTHPEILRSNIVNTALLLLKLGIDNPCHFDFLDLPSESSLEDAFYQLLYFGAVDEELQLTSFGKQMAELPVDVCLSRMLLKSPAYDCSCDVAIVASMLEVGNVFTRPPSRGAEADAAHAIFEHRDGDHLTLFNTFHDFYAHGHNNSNNRYCYDHFLRYQAMQRAIQVYNQLRQLMSTMQIPILSTYDAEHKTVNSVALRRAILEGFFLQIAYRHDINSREYRTIRDGCKAVLHKQSVLQNSGSNSSSSNISQLPRWVMYDRLEVQGEQGTFMRIASKVDVAWLVEVSDYYADPHEIADADIVLELTKAREANKGSRTIVSSSII